MTCESSSRTPCIGIFDSGIGGLSVTREILNASFQGDLLYLADAHNHPYGPKEPNKVLQYCRRITTFLIAEHVTTVVLACNTASAAALHPLREMFPEVQFVGMEPAVKPAAELTRTGKYGELATSGTLCGKPYEGVVQRFAKGVDIFEQPCEGLAAMIENGEAQEVMREHLQDWIEPMIKAGVDQLALACTHYPLIIELIREVAGDSIHVIDPSAAVARQALRVAGDGVAGERQSVRRLFYSTAQTTTLQNGCARFLSMNVEVLSAAHINTQDPQSSEASHETA